MDGAEHEEAVDEEEDMDEEDDVGRILCVVVVVGGGVCRYDDLPMLVSWIPNCSTERGLSFVVVC